MDIYLHHYPASLFSEKVRLLFGYHGLSWRSVIISSIMPRPQLMPLSGGYRKTPILQIGANVYCDTKIIAQALARHTANPSLYSAGFVAHRVADWADSQLFRVMVAMNFRPEVLQVTMGQFSAEEAAAFQKDRAELSKGAPITSFGANAAMNYLHHYLTELDHSLRGKFLFGDQPSIADFSVYHCLWFLNNNQLNRAELAPYRTIAAWMERMAAFGHGEVIDSDAATALAAGAAATPVLPDIESRPPAGLALGDAVAVTPVDYGRIPVAGELVAYSADEIVVLRTDPEAGQIMVHFPTAGFEVTRTQ